MATPRHLDLEDAVQRPGTYFNPTTEMLLVVDDSASIDRELFAEVAAEESEWVAVSDEVPVDDTVRDEAIERFETRYHGGASGAIAADDDDEDEVDDIEPDEDPEEL
ncbi:MAG: hypothetical protein H0V81_11030 [Solirubrobacterales bacterium]|nr:hypothetical protein [Solirubrobacterales bacterium]